MRTLHLPRPHPSEYAPAFHDEITSVPDAPDFVSLLRQQAAETYAIAARFGEAGASVRYAAGKWTLRESLGHLADCERVIAYRALSLARGEPGPLPGFDHNAWVPAARFEERTLDDVLGEFLAVREATARLVRGLPADAAARDGLVGTRRTTAAAMLYLIAGHERHHQALWRDRYLPALRGEGGA
jgi:hypothetical protein